LAVKITSNYIAGRKLTQDTLAGSALVALWVGAARPTLLPPDAASQPAGGGETRFQVVFY